MKPDQLQLVNAPTTEDDLTDRQAKALDIIRHAGRDGIAADELGQQLHAWQGKHSGDQLCEWCPAVGREIGRALRSRGHVKSHRDGSWYALEGAVEPAANVQLFTRPDGTEGDIPF